MKKLALKLEDIGVESFEVQEKSRGGVVSREDTVDPNCGGTHSLAYATHCDCSGGANCTTPCVEYSQATDLYICCG
ncbi:MAG TPA: hypothetical protein VF092_00210 [Longimicrobium sp.]